MNNRLFRTVLRLVIAASLTVLVLWWKASPAAVWRAASAAEPSWIALALVLVAIDRLLNAYRWIWLLCPIERDRRPTTWSIVRVFFTSTFAGTFLPGTVGGDVVRAYGLARLQVPGAIAAASVAMDRLLGVLSLLIMSVIGLSLGSVGGLASNRGIQISLLVVAAVCALGAALVFSERVEQWTQRIATRLPGARVRGLVSGLVDATRAYASFHGRLAAVLAASIGVQWLRVAQAYCLGRALGLSAPFEVYLEFLPLILIVVLLPISFNGIGTSQAAFVWLFARVGTPEPHAFALSVLFLALGVAGNLPGGLLYAFRPPPLPPTRE